MAFLFLLLLASVKGSQINFDLAFSEECMDGPCPVIYYSDKPIRPIGTPYDEQSIFAIQSTPKPPQTQPSATGITAMPSTKSSPQTPKPKTFENKSSQNDQTGLPVPSAVPISKPSVSIDLTRNPRIWPVRRPSRFIDPQYIALEKVHYKFRSVRGTKLEKFLTYIAENDYVGFSQDQEISLAFGRNFKSLQKNDVEYFPHYVVRFGATNFLRCFNKYVEVDFEGAKLIDAFKNLIGTKPLKTVIEIMKFNFNIPETAQKEISQLIRVKYPMLHCFDFFFFEMTHHDQETRNITFKILSAVTEAEKLKHFMELAQKLAVIAEKQYSHFSLVRFLEFPKMYPESFVKFSNLAKFVFIFIALVQSDTSYLVKLIGMFPDLLLHRYNGLTVFDHVIRLKRRSFIPFMLSIVPEHAMEPRPDGNVSLYESLIIADDVEMIKAFELAGFSSETKRIRGMNAIQLAFELKSPKLFDYFTDKFGQDKVMSYLVEIYGSELEVVRIANSKFPVLAVSMLRRRFERSGIALDKSIDELGSNINKVINTINLNLNRNV